MDLSFAGSTRTWGSLDQNQFSRLHLFPPFNGFTLWSRAWGFHALLPQKCACSPKIPVLSLFPLKTLFISEIQQLLPKFLWCLLNLIYFIALWKSYFSFQDQHLCDVPRGLFVGFCVCSCWFVFLDFLKSDLKVFCLFLFFFLSFFFFKDYSEDEQAMGWTAARNQDSAASPGRPGKKKHCFLSSLFSLIPLPSIAPQ